MNGKLHRHLFRFVFVVLCGLAVTAMLTVPALSRSATQQAVAVLSAPYYGSTRLSSIFDHDVEPNHILAFTGAAAHRDDCPCPPGRNCVHPTFNSAYYSCDINDYLYYDGHTGIDYMLRYDYVRAAAPGTVERSGWANVNHQISYGLHVRINHDLNGDGITDYQTIYGHMSVLRVRQNDEIAADADEFTRIIGISGNTGRSTGPHLHFEVRNAAGAVVDPYGPNRNPANTLWIERPSIAPHVIYSSGNRPLQAPPINENEPGAFTVDDGDTGFVENPVGCWTVDNTSGWADDHRWRNVPGQNPGDCTATWNFPGTPGRYNVFVYVPNNHATTDAAQYTIRHTESPSRPWSKQNAWAVVDQSDYPNLHHSSSWVYVGTYYFSNQHGTDYVRLESTPLNPVADTMMAADAVRFAPVRYRIYLPLVTRRWPPIPDTPVLNPISNPGNAPNYTVSWQAAYLASTYTLQEATNANFSGAVTRYSGAGTLWTATNKPVGTYYYRVRARNSWGDSGWSNVQSTTVLPPAGWQIITSQDFEGAFPGGWIVGDNNGPDYGEYYWGKRTCRPYAGSYSGWGVGGGAQGAALSCGSNYPHHADSWMVYGPFSLAGVARAELQFKLWLYTELENDYVFYSASVDGEHFHGYAISGNTQGWTDKSLDLANVPALGNLLGRPQVWVVVGFYSNGSVSYAEGGYVDDVVLRQCYRECPSGSSAAVSGSEQIREVPIAVTRQSGRILAAPVVAPQPSASPLSVAEPFRSPLPITQP